jgi:hydroxymethylpyrimidine pyrophosphatase-like HAD family hydrolase
VTEYRLVAVDLDGTLLRSDRSISPRTRRAVALARSAGLDVVFVTVRHPAAIARYVEELDLTGQAICCGGAAVCDLPSGDLLWHKAIPAEDAAAVAGGLMDAYPGLRFGWVPETGALGYDTRYTARLLIGPAYHADPREIDRPVLKVWAIGPELEGELPDGVPAVLAGRAEVNHHDRGVADLVAPGVSKVGTLLNLCRRKGVRAEQVIAFGDTFADLGMIRWAGHGVFMANARPELYGEADEVAPGCDDDGVAVVLERVLGAAEELVGP